MAQSRRALGHKSYGKKTKIVTYSMDRENEVIKKDIYYISIVCLKGSGTIPIREERLQISEAGRIKNEGTYECCAA